MASCTMTRFVWRWLTLSLVVVGGLAACSTLEQDPPVPTVANINTLPTAIFLTENAPPPGFNLIHVDPVDANLAAHRGWAYTITGTFTGTVDDSGEPATGAVDVRVKANQLGQTRHVILEAQGSAFLNNEALLRLEGVRWSNDYYVVDVNGRCTQDQASGTAIADLGAHQIIGGVSEAIPTGHRREIGGLEAWQYTFAPSAVRLPALHRTPASTTTIGADLWFAPAVNAVLVYEINVEVAHVHLLWADQTASPVSGTLYMRYELAIDQLDTLPNISIPHGC